MANQEHYKERTVVLVVGQTPPPFGGQAVMIQKMMEGEFRGVSLSHVRMDFSSDMEEIGKFQLKKLWKLVSLIGAIVKARFSTGADILYYPPAGPNLVPFLRDVCVLICVRRLFRSTIFHFHASGISELYAKLPFLLKKLFFFAYGRPQASISMTALGPADGGFLRSEKQFLVPYGIEDFARRRGSLRQPSETPQILFVGMVGEEKGVGVLLAACLLLLNDGISFSCRIVGRFESLEVEKAYHDYVRTNLLQNHVTFEGVLIGDAKWEKYESADIFCFPSHFSSESFPVVILEAMQFSLPVVATHWKGIPSQVDDGTTGYLVPTKDPDAVAEKLRRLLLDSQLRSELGKSARIRFEADYRLDTFYRRLGLVFQYCKDLER